jgi:flagellar hook-associated protein 3 FlgL
MAGRITNGMLNRSVLSDLNEITARMAATQRMLSSGRQLTRTSDDPFAASRSLTLRSELEGQRQHQRNVEDAIGWENATDVALSHIGDVVQRARELTVAGGNDAAGQPARVLMATEIDQLIETVKQEASAAYGGRYIFSGTRTDVRPYAPGSDAYQGDGVTIAREIGPGVSIGVNVIASDILGDGQAAADGRLLDTLRGIADHLRGGTPADADALRSSDLRALDTNLDALSRLRATVGTTTTRLATAADRLSQLEESTTKLLSDVEDADMAKAMLDYSTQQTVYQAALRAGASIVQPSLLDFLR